MLKRQYKQKILKLIKVNKDNNFKAATVKLMPSLTENMKAGDNKMMSLKVMKMTITTIVYLPT